MSMSPKVSVVMPVYNGEKFLQEAISSILNQTFTDFEFLIIDDGSDDDTPMILSKYSEKDDRIRVYSQSNSGLMLSLNRLLSNVRGKYIARMDADDISLPERLEKQVVFLDSHPKIGVVGTQMEIISSNGNHIGYYNVPLEHAMISWMLCVGHSFGHPSVMLRNNLAPKFNYPASEDYELWTRLAKHTQFANLPEVLIKYRHHNSCISVSKKSIQKEYYLKAQQLYFTDITRNEVTLKHVDNLVRSQRLGATLSQEATQQAAELLVKLLAVNVNLYCKTIHEINEITDDAISRLEKILQCRERDIEKKKLTNRLKEKTRRLKKLLRRMLLPFIN